MCSQELQELRNSARGKQSVSSSASVRASKYFAVGSVFEDYFDLALYLTCVVCAERFPFVMVHWKGTTALDLGKNNGCKHKKSVGFVFLLAPRM